MSFPLEQYEEILVEAAAVASIGKLNPYFFCIEPPMPDIALHVSLKNNENERKKLTEWTPVQ